MKILLIHNYYRYRGGEDRYVDILEKALIRMNHQVIRFCCDSRDIESFSFLKKCLLPFRLIHSPSLNRQLLHLINREKPSLAIVHNLSPMLSFSILSVLKAAHVPVVKRLENYKFLCLNGLFLRNDFSLCERCSNGNFLHGVWHRCYQRSFFSSLGIAAAETWHKAFRTLTRNVDSFIATSQFVKEKFVASGFPASSIRVLPNFIDFDPIDDLQAPGDYALYLGRLSGEKGVMTLLKAFSSLPQFQLKIVGTGPMESELMAFVHDQKLDHVQLLGFIDGEEKRRIISRARFFIFPSECYESFGYTVAESMACGVPVLASRLGSVREIVQEGHTGYLFEPGNISDLQEKISFFFQMDDDALMTMKKNSLEYAGVSFTREAGCRKLQQFLGVNGPQSPPG